jgi:hypothetical protein
MPESFAAARTPLVCVLLSIEPLYTPSEGSLYVGDGLRILDTGINKVLSSLRWISYRSPSVYDV